MIINIIKAILILAMASGVNVYAAAENVSNSSAESIDAHVAVNSAGEVGVVWIEKVSDANQRVFFSIRSGGKWSSPAAIPGQSGNCANPCIAKGVSSGFAAAWHDKSSNCIRVSQYKGSWSTPVNVSQTAGFDFGNPAITTTANGRIAVAFQRGNKLFTDVYVAIYRSSWSAPVNVSNTKYASKYPDLCSGPGGEIYVVWQDNLYNPPTEDSLRTMINNDRGSGSWGSASYIDDIREWCFRPVVAVNSQNDILAAYYYKQARAFYATFRLDGDWQDPRVISDVGNHQEHEMYISDACPFGRDDFLFIYRDCGFNILYTVARNGIPGKAVALTSGGQCYHPAIDYGSDGAAACWTDRRANSDVFVSIFDPDDEETDPPLPPDASIQPPLGVEANYRNIPLSAPDLKTELVVNRNLFIVHYYRKITWAFDPSWSAWGIAPAKYRVYRRLKTSTEWQAMAEVPPPVLLYVDKDGVTQEDRFDYQVRAVDSLGNDFYAYNWIRWAPNPLNVEWAIKVKGYRVYRKPSGQSADGYTLLKAVEATANSLEDHSTEIRQQAQYDYAVSAVSDAGDESAKAPARKIAGSAIEYIPERFSGEKLKIH